MNSNSATSLYSYETSHELSSVDGNGIANGVSYYIKKSDNPAIFGYCLPQQIHTIMKLCGGQSHAGNVLHDNY